MLKQCFEFTELYLNLRNFINPKTWRHRISHTKEQR